MMTNQERLKRVLEYIKTHLDEPLSVEVCASVAHFSAYHFHRIFTGFMGESLYAYIKRQRIERAAGELLYKDKAITHIAFDCGYESVTAFNKAFKALSGVAPSTFRKDKRSDIDFSLKQYRKKGKTMKPDINEIDDITVFYHREEGDYHQKVDKAWAEVLKACDEKKAKAFYGIIHDNPNVISPAHCRYDACVATDENLQVLAQKNIAGGRYAVFKQQGYDITDLCNTIFADWFPKSKVSLREEPLFVEYGNAHLRDSAPEKLYALVYIPIQ